MRYLGLDLGKRKLGVAISDSLGIIASFYDNIKISSPYKDKIHDLEVLNFPYIISKLCPENIIDIYRFILFEQKILFINKDYNNISSVIDSFTNVLYPIDWINTIIPIMSSPMVKYLQTYLPFINGISEDLYENSAKQALEDAEEGVFLIFIYNDTIKIRNEMPCSELLMKFLFFVNFIFKGDSIYVNNTKESFEYILFSAVTFK